MKTFQQNGVNYPEEWRDITGYEGRYRVSNFGRVKTLSRFIVNGRHSNRKYTAPEKILKPSMRANGYGFVSLYLADFKMISIHRLVALMFIPNPENKPCVNHKDGNKLNNHVDNLEWVTNRENTVHAIANGLQNTGEKSKLAKLKNADILEIREIWNTSSHTMKTKKVLADKYLVSIATIEKIVYRYYWKNV